MNILIIVLFYHCKETYENRLGFMLTKTITRYALMNIVIINYANLKQVMKRSLTPFLIKNLLQLLTLGAPTR